MKSCPHHEKWHLSELPGGILTGRLIKDAQDYRRAADTLQNDEDGPIVRPAYFCLTHSIEMLLKTFLAAKGTRAAAMRQHCLSCLHDSALRHGLPEMAKMDMRLSHLREYAMLMRYPDYIMREILVYKQVAQVYDELWEEIEPVARLALLKDIHIPHEVDYFYHSGK